MGWLLHYAQEGCGKYSRYDDRVKIEHEGNEAANRRGLGEADVTDKVHCSACGKECPSPFTEGAPTFYLCTDCAKSLFAGYLQRFTAWLRGFWK
jgi:hypothetical protein